MTEPEAIVTQTSWGQVLNSLEISSKSSYVKIKAKNNNSERWGNYKIYSDSTNSIPFSIKSKVFVLV